MREKTATAIKNNICLFKKRHSGSVSVVEAGNMELVELPLSLSFSAKDLAVVGTKVFFKLDL